MLHQGNSQIETHQSVNRRHPAKVTDDITLIPSYSITQVFTHLHSFISRNYFIPLQEFSVSDDISLFSHILSSFSSSIAGKHKKYRYITFL